MKNYVIMFLFLFIPFINYAQEVKVLSLNDAISLSLANSKTLQLSKSKVDQAVSVYNQTLDKALPNAKASAIYNHVEIPANVLDLGTGNPIRLPSSADAYLGTLSIQELIFAGNKLKYAKESTDLLKKIAELDVEKDKDDITLDIVNSYLNLYKLEASKEVITQNLNALDSQLKQTRRFFDQGLVTKNDVLRLQLQRSNIELTGLDLDRNENIVNYNLNILLGFNGTTKIKTTPLIINPKDNLTFSACVDSALTNRKELQQIDFRTDVAEKNILSLKADKLPTLGAGVSAYYVNPSGKFIPNNNQFITPISLGLTLSWNISTLWTNKNKVAEATIKKTETSITKNILIDNIKMDVNRSYENYIQSLNRIKVINTSIAQATENDKIVQSKYENNISPITDRIDANTQLFQTKINLEIAKTEAQIAYYNLLKSAGLELNR
ncbi:MAG: TolC family protein [Bacteroidetes bacterium]|nr:TolC family protein [Bacteroidota bacterium]MBU1373444.1 TolC family protein [Bacteroidota bacterium]MBU1485202.1 TolC family protein [Bacteroidota bacterium]MBU1761426.1 TolC family protein [Bacteroidota bacterium]MBU2267877.1 TolC family protein [Bacteroidota bacterium]